MVEISGMTLDSDSVNLGSNPSPPTNEINHIAGASRVVRQTIPLVRQSVHGAFHTYIYPLEACF